MSVLITADAALVSLLGMLITWIWNAFPSLLPPCLPLRVLAASQGAPRDLSSPGQEAGHQCPWGSKQTEPAGPGSRASEAAGSPG